MGWDAGYMGDCTKCSVLMVAGVLMVIGGGCAAQFSNDQARSVGANAPLATITLKPYAGDLKAIDVAVGERTLPFLFDTGGGITCVTPEIAKASGRASFGRLTGFRAGGERLDLMRCAKLWLALGSASFEIEPGVFDLMPLLKQLGDVPVVGGVVALDLFADVPVTIDFAHDKLIIESPASLAARVDSMTPLTVRLARQSAGVSLDLFVAVRAKTGTLWLEVDSGNPGPVRLSPHAITQSGLTAEANDSLQLTLDVIGLGPVQSDVFVEEKIYDGVLNTSFLKEILLTIDFPSGRAWARKNHP